MHISIESKDATADRGVEGEHITGLLCTQRDSQPLPPLCDVPRKFSPTSFAPDRNAGCRCLNRMAYWEQPKRLSGQGHL